ncbi:uncharacterized protein Fot_03889 [Forsythia ovata]|uniref:Uncharacterized protein n=1 Tax=Forsythia ovata TaxID=205694 RepID=A0ABD1XBV4_9LAMI
MIRFQNAHDKMLMESCKDERPPRIPLLPSDNTHCKTMKGGGEMESLIPSGDAISDSSSGSITNAFNSPKTAAPCSMSGITEDLKEQSTKSEVVLDLKDPNANNLCVNLKFGNSDNYSAHSQVQCISCKAWSFDNDSAHFKHKDRGYMDLSPNGHVQFISSKERSIENAHEQALRDKNVHEHERWNSDSFSVVAEVQCDEGESSFSASGFTTYSGPIAYSRSLSVQSDSSTTSTQSFAFPV